MTTAKLILLHVI